MTKRIHVIINPAAGQPKPILNTLNDVFHPASIDWDISLTKRGGDAHRYAHEAVAVGADVVAAYGGDGTVMEVAMALMGEQTPMAILPGGTANLMSVELGVPKNLAQAAAIAVDPDSPVCQVDMGQVGEAYFLLRVGLGFSGRKIEYADRQLKDRFGILAYSIASLKALKDSNRARYRLVLDGERVEVEGLSCLVDNAGNIGISGISPVQNISVSDGLLDVIVVRNTAFATLLASGTSFTDTKPEEEMFYHWQAREIIVEADPPQPSQIDGEVGPHTPMTIKVIPQAVRVLTAK